MEKIKLALPGDIMEDETLPFMNSFPSGALVKIKESYGGSAMVGIFIKKKKSNYILWFFAFDGKSSPYSVDVTEYKYPLNCWEFCVP